MRRYYSSHAENPAAHSPGFQSDGYRYRIANCITLAQVGGIGIVHRNLTVEQQAAEVETVKKYESGMISDPVTVHPEQKIGEALQIMERYRISGLPVVVEGHRLVGILTNRDLRFEKRLERQVREVMTTNLTTARPGISLEEAKSILQANRIEKLPLVDEHNRLRGLITVKDMDKATRHPNSSKDAFGRRCAPDRYRAWPFAKRHRRAARDQEGSGRYRGDRGQRRDQRWRQGAH